MCFLAFSEPVLTQLFFPKPPTFFLSHASAEVRGENTPERKVALTEDRTHNLQVMSPTRSPLSHPGGAFVIWYSVNSFPNSNISDWSKLKAIADDMTTVAEMLISLSDKVENIVGNGENAGFQHFLLFKQCFQKPSLSGSLKVGIVWQRVDQVIGFYLENVENIAENGGNAGYQSFYIFTYFQKHAQHWLLEMEIIQ